jgi:hypothetical protein
VLKEAMDDHGGVTDADRTRAAEVSGLPEADPLRHDLLTR